MRSLNKTALFFVLFSIIVQVLKESSYRFVYVLARRALSRFNSSYFTQFVLSFKISFSKIVCRLRLWLFWTSTFSSLRSINFFNLLLFFRLIFTDLSSRSWLCQRKVWWRFSLSFLTSCLHSIIAVQQWDIYLYWLCTLPLNGLLTLLPFMRIPCWRWFTCTLRTCFSRWICYDILFQFFGRSFYPFLRCLLLISKENCFINFFVSLNPIAASTCTPILCRWSVLLWFHVNIPFFFRGNTLVHVIVYAHEFFTEWVVADGKTHKIAHLTNNTSSLRYFPI